MTIQHLPIARPSQSPIERATRLIEEGRHHAEAAALDALALAAEASARLEELASLGDALCPEVARSAPLLARQISAGVQRMTVALRGGGRIR